MKKIQGEEVKPIAIGTDQLKNFGLHKLTEANNRSKKMGCRYFKVGRKVLYLVSDIEDWIKRNPVLTKDSFPE
jgi:hypothetical protein